MPLKKNVLSEPHDFADYLTTADDVRATIAAAFEDGDPVVITRLLGAAARSKGMAALADETGLSRESLYKSLAETGNPEFRTILTVVKAFGLEITVKNRAKKAAKRSAIQAHTPATSG